MADFKPNFAWLLRQPVCLLGFGFGTGLAPFAPGTFGTLPALPMAFFLHHTGIGGITLALVCVLMFIAGIWICSRTERALGIQDFGGIVWDEIAAMVLVLAYTPFDWRWWLLAFVLFRFFDALKPWPIKWFDARIHGGLGIMLDDLIAALFTLGVLKMLNFMV